MSHEIRTPMNAIIGFSDLLKGSINDPILNKYLSSVQSNAKTLLGLISDILELSEIEAGQAEVNTEAVDTKLFFGDIVGIYKSNFEEAKLENKLIIDADFPASIIIDSAKVRQIITNLLSNALKFTHEGYVNLLIAQNKSNQQVHFIDLVITIEDSGIGIPKEHQQTLFHSFSQLDDQSNRKYEGMGLGLSICKKLCSLMNGNITVNSKEGEGTKISLTLPGIEIAKTNEAEAYCSIKRNNIRFEQGRILLIDNVKSNQEYIYALLENTAIKIDIVNNIDGAQECIKLNKYQLVISDIKIHYGVKQINHIIAQLRETNIPIIGISNISKEELKKAELLGFSSLLTYPINADTFYHELSKYLNHSIIPSTSNKQEDKSFENSILKPQEKQELLALLNGSLMLMWKEFELVQSIKKVHLFSSELSKVAEKFNYSPLQSFAHKLIVSVNSFDIIEIKKNLKLYPQLILDITKTD